MNRARKSSVWGRVLMAAAAVIAVLGLTGASCRPAMEQNITRRFGPDVIRGRDAAKLAKECGEGVGTPAQVAAAQAAADSSRIAAAQLWIAMDDLREAYAEREAATQMRVDVARQNDTWAAEIAELQRKAGLAMVEAANDHDILHMHSFYLPARYSAPTSSQPNVEPFTNANHLLIRTAHQQSANGLGMAQTAFDQGTASASATSAEKTQLQQWLDEARLAAGNVESAHATGQSQLYSTPDDITQLAVRYAYKVMELGFRARALQMTIELRGDQAEREKRAGERESEAIARYQQLLAIAGDAQRRAQDAANSAYQAAVNCGIDTAPIVPGSPEWNDTFWQISSP